jgi:hypothetical protein
LTRQRAKRRGKTQKMGHFWHFPKLCISQIPTLFADARRCHFSFPWTYSSTAPRRKEEARRRWKLQKREDRQKRDLRSQRRAPLVRPTPIRDRQRYTCIRDSVCLLRTVARVYVRLSQGRPTFTHYFAPDLSRGGRVSDRSKIRQFLSRSKNFISSRWSP